MDLPSLKKKDMVEARVVPSILLDSGYTLLRNSFGKVTIDGPGIKPTELCFGVYNLWFLIQWIEWSAGRPYYGGYCQEDKDFGQGKTVGKFYKPIGAEGHPGSVFRPKSVGNYWSFAGHVKGEVAKPGLIMPVTRIAANCDFHFDELPAESGYWKKNLSPRDDEGRRAWVHALDQRGFGHAFDSTETKLYFSNAFSVLTGYPPTAELLGYPKLAVEIPSSDDAQQNGIQEGGMGPSTSDKVDPGTEEEERTAEGEFVVDSGSGLGLRNREAELAKCAGQ